MLTNQAKVQAGLEPYTSSLSRREVVHALRRASFGADPEMVNAFVGRTASDLVDELLDFATNTNLNPLPPKPAWADSPKPDRKDTPSDIVREYNENNRFWLDELAIEMITQFRIGGLRERMTLFWHNHFVTEVEVYELAVYAYRYLNIIRTNAMGDFKQMVREMGLTPAMLIYLNGNTNEKSSPNENYARELLELFTMSPNDRTGKANYSQQDVQEIARALTGWFVNEAGITAELFEKEFDEGQKTFLNRTGAFNYDDVVDVIFEARAQQTAYFICSKLYKEFVYEEIDDDIVQELAGVFVQNNFQIAPVLEVLLKSAHFYDPQFIGAKIKSPAELIAGMLIETGFAPGQGTLSELRVEFENLEQVLLDPPDVSGWPGYRAWLSTNTLPTRWALADSVLFTGRNNQPIDLTAMASLLPDSDGILSAFTLPLAIAEFLLPVRLAELDISRVDDEFSGDLIANPIPIEILNGPTYAISLAKLFLGDVPWYEWSLDEDGANGRLLSYVQYLMQLPEYQLT